MSEEIDLRKVMENLVGENGLRRYYNQIIKILKEYMDIEEQYYFLIALWTIGTYLHKQFSSYPYLYFNAMKGSGKTRMLKIISNLAKNGKLSTSMTESVLFRKAKERTICIDELEYINAKGNENLRLLLNSAYKKGSVVERNKRKANGSYEIEEFDVYCPVALANIWGMEDVLSDRCIKVVLEKSSNAKITRLIENFENDIEFQKIRGGLKRLTEKIDDDLNLFGNIISYWNSYIKSNATNNTNSIKDINSTNDIIKTDIIDISDAYILLYEKIKNTSLIGRDLELFFPLFITADICGELDKTLILAEKISKERKESDREENRDVQFIEFIAQSNYEGFINVSDVVNDFRKYLGCEEQWINSWWVGRATRRLKLLLESSRTGKARKVKLDIKKAKEKLLIFKEPEEIDFSDLDNILK